LGLAEILQDDGCQRNLNAERTIHEWENYAATIGQWEGHVQEKQAQAQELLEKAAQVRSAFEATGRFVPARRR
jgi:hypothetical protein